MLKLTTKIKLKRILNIAIPSGLQGAFDMLSMAMALFFLGQISPLNFTALGTGANYVIVFFPFSAIFGIGTNVLMSRRYGAKNYSEMNSVYATMHIAAAIFSILVLALAWACLPLYLKALNLSEELYTLTHSYVSLTMFAIPSIMIKNVLISGFAATGDTKRPFYVKIFLTFFSIAGYYTLIDGSFGMPALGLSGAAITTLFVSYLELFILFLLPFFVKTQLRLSLAFQSSFLVSALKVGFPTALERVFGIFSLNVVLIFVGSYAGAYSPFGSFQVVLDSILSFLDALHLGIFSAFILALVGGKIYKDSAMTGFQAGTKIEGFSFLPGFGFMVAVMSLVGQSIGAKKYHLAEDYTRISALIASVILGVCGVILAVFAEPFSKIFIAKDSMAVQISIWYLIAVGLSQVPMILSFIYDGTLRGAGYTQIPLFINIGSMSLFRLLPMWICSHYGLEIYFLFIIIFTETYIRSLIFYLAFKSGIWKKPKEL